MDNHGWKNMDEKKDNYMLARILFIFILTKEGNYEFAELELRSLKRFLLKQQKSSKFEKNCISFLSKLISNPEKEKLKSTISAFITSCNILKKIPHESSNFFCFDFAAHLNSYFK